MNAFRTLPTHSAAVPTPPQPATAVVSLALRHIHRERAFGVGYGNSSGYASTRQYASNWTPPRFKFA